ncbi:phenylacetyl-CoA:acceptor oxidoreductase [Azoarcus olearius]|uniref:DmsC/YnfH family molybdoenzyme membrane anchor subunit n=1 Tax=Azoarcus sp. (strain BH72) TaxID=418699 RepID=UPI0008061BF7|nr:DmsC/YnfH family molybdoenzyme membrane anchor subunit [Azoarcus olearius]ANQ85140.1 phenylacetyl-CoA:acceptor oxidoreductase [Azoarcus olearius]
MNPSKFGRFGTAHQTSWDWRAAGNFIGGGSGSALIALASFTAYPGATPLWALLAGLALIGAGLLCVWAEIGRPLRAFNVLFHPQTSWMTREAFVAALIFASAAAALATGLVGVSWLAGALALLFLYCQGRILRAARGIPAWRQPGVVPLIAATGLVEGAGVLLLLSLAFGSASTLLCGLLLAVVAVRALCWLSYRRRLLAGDVTPATRRALAPAHVGLMLAGTLAPVAALVAALLWPAGAGVLGALAALPAVAAGWHFKFLLVTRAAQVQGYALGKTLRRGHPLAQPR